MRGRCWGNRTMAPMGVLDNDGRRGYPSLLARCARKTPCVVSRVVVGSHVDVCNLLWGRWLSAMAGGRAHELIPWSGVRGSCSTSLAQPVRAKETGLRRWTLRGRVWGSLRPHCDHTVTIEASHLSGATLSRRSKTKAVAGNVSRGKASSGKARTLNESVLRWTRAHIGKVTRKET